MACDYFDQTVECVVRQLKGRTETRGIVLYGSFASGAAVAGSDIDFLWIVTEGTDIAADNDSLPEITAQWMHGFFVDVRRLTEDQIREELFATVITNENHMVTALSNCRIMYETSGSVRQLVQEAERVRLSGPSMPSKLEVRLGKYYFRRALDEIKAALRAPQSEGMVRVLGVTLFVNLIYGYCRTHRLWAHKLQYLIADAEKTDPSLHMLCRRYLDARTTNDVVESLELLAQAALVPVGGWGEKSSAGGTRLADTS
jgi:predicted nucleotidyltransferase